MLYPSGCPQSSKTNTGFFFYYYVVLIGGILVPM